MSFSARLARRLAFAAVSFLGITIVTFGLLHLATPVIQVADPLADPVAKARAARLAERYALDRPLFFNPDPADARRVSTAPLATPGESQVAEWLAVARIEGSGRGNEQSRSERIRAGDALAAAGRGAVAAMLPRLLRENVLVLAMGLDLLHGSAAIPDFGKPEGEPRRALRPDEQRHNDTLRRSVALWWRRHENEYRERSWLWHAAVGRVTETRYGAWLGDLVRFDFGDSIAIQPETPVVSLLRERLPVTVLLMSLATVLLFAVGLPLGLLCAAGRGRAFDRISQGILFVLHATPESWVATLCLIYLASDAHWHVFPVGGMLSPAIADKIAAGELAFFSSTVLLDLLRHLVLPVLVLVFPAWVVVARHIRAAAIEALGSRFVTAARARGIPGRRILFVHVLRNCAPPAVTLFTSVLPGLVTGSILIEVLFSLDGMGLLSWQAATLRDFPVGMAILTLVAAVMLVAHVLTDVVHALLDPRVRTA